jgi:hypothetical protein
MFIPFLLSLFLQASSTSSKFPINYSLPSVGFSFLEIAGGGLIAIAIAAAVHCFCGSKSISRTIPERESDSDFSDADEDGPGEYGLSETFLPGSDEDGTDMPRDSSKEWEAEEEVSIDAEYE